MKKSQESGEDCPVSEGLFPKTGVSKLSIGRNKLSLREDTSFPFFPASPQFTADWLLSQPLTVLLLRFPVSVKLTSPMTSPSPYFTSQRHRLLLTTLIDTRQIHLLCLMPQQNYQSHLHPTPPLLPPAHCCLGTGHPLGHSIPVRALQSLSFTSLIS